MNVNNQYKNILVFNPAYLGDTIITTPLIRALHVLYPDAKISFCVRPEHADLFYNISFINEVIIFDKRNTQKGFSGLLKFVKIISNYKFDLIIDLHLSLRSTTLFSMVKNSHIVGFSSAVMSYLFDKRVEKKQELCEVERNLMILSVLCDDFTLDEAKQIGGALTAYIDEHLKNNALSFFNTAASRKKIVGIAPGSVWPTKRYPVEYFVNVANDLYGKGYAIALFGGKDDKESLDDFAASFKHPYFDFAYKTSLKELPAILSAIDLLLTNDSGAMHISIAAGTPTVSIFGPTVKSLGFFPYDDKSIVVENNDVDCRPCGKHGGNTCPKGHFKCMKDINPERVVSAALSILQQG